MAMMDRAATTAEYSVRIAWSHRERFATVNALLCNHRPSATLAKLCQALCGKLLARLPSFYLVFTAALTSAVFAVCLGWPNGELLSASTCASELPSGERPATCCTIGTTPKLVPLLRSHVVGVLFGVAKEQMGGVDAERIVAVMEHPHTIRNWPIVNLPGDAMRRAVLPLPVHFRSELAVWPFSTWIMARSVISSGPEPAAIGLVDLGKESCVCIHLSILNDAGRFSK